MLIYMCNQKDPRGCTSRYVDPCKCQRKDPCGCSSSSNKSRRSYSDSHSHQSYDKSYFRRSYDNYPSYGEYSYNNNQMTVQDPVYNYPLYGGYSYSNNQMTLKNNLVLQDLMYKSTLALQTSYFPLPFNNCKCNK